MNKQEMKDSLQVVYNTLNILEVKGVKNMQYVIGCCNIIKKVMDDLDKTPEIVMEVGNDGNGEN